MDIRDRFMAAMVAFRKPSLVMSISDPDDFISFDSRLLRYQMLWSYYDNTAYDVIHAWATQYKTKFGLYRPIRNIFNPSNRICNFHQAHIWGGKLDMNAGNGDYVKTALPIITENEAIRPAISNIWKWSNWQVRKDIITLTGSVMGDSFIRVVDDTEHGRVYLEVVKPTTVKNVVKDVYGNVKSYVIEYECTDPNNKSRTVKYTEIVGRGDGNAVVFQTYKDGVLFAWNGIAAEWEEPYGFVPFRHCAHIDIGLDYGWSELYPAMSKFREIDDIASKISDHIRKSTESPMFMAGIKQSDNQTVVNRRKPSSDNPYPEREEDIHIKVSDPTAKVYSMVSSLDINAVISYIGQLSEEIEKDYPELMLDESAELAASSGRALRIKQQPVSDKEQMRRTNYDGALVDVHNMAMSIGTMRGYDGFAGLPVNGYANSAFDHSIGDRPVFSTDVLDDLEQSSIFWNTANTAIAAGVSLPAYLKSEGYTDEQIRLLVKQQQRVASASDRRAALERLMQQRQSEITVITEDNDINDMEE